MELLHQKRLARRSSLPLGLLIQQQQQQQGDNKTQHDADNSKYNDHHSPASSNAFASNPSTTSTRKNQKKQHTTTIQSTSPSIDEDHITLSQHVVARDKLEDTLLQQRDAMEMQSTKKLIYLSARRRSISGPVE